VKKLNIFYLTVTNSGHYTVTCLLFKDFIEIADAEIKTADGIRHIYRELHLNYCSLSAQHVKGWGEQYSAISSRIIRHFTEAVKRRACSASS
jgi:hypothetical protein